MARIVFMGSPDFALPALNALHEHHDVVGVVTQPDSLAGRGRVLRPPAIKEAAQRLGLPLIQPRRLSEDSAMQQLADWAPDLIVVAAFGQILKPAVLELPPQGCINVHASLLPRWRGAAPIHAAILNGDEETGITIMKMDPGLDTGPILSQRAIPIQEDDTGGRLFDKLARLGAKLLIETLPGYLSGRLVPVPQDESRATMAPTLKKAEGELDFSQPAEMLARTVRAFNPWPGAYTFMDGQPFKVHRAHSAQGSGPPGQRSIHAGLPAIATGDGLLVLDKVQPAGKQAMGGADFLHGARDWATD
jgi:methionyl-tRNA formyltransferase